MSHQISFCATKYYMSVFRVIFYITKELMKSGQRILSLLVCLACAITAFSQVKITGKVIDAAGEPIEFATVRLLGTAVGTNTDTKGEYEMTVPKADTLMVEFSCLGYSTVT